MECKSCASLNGTLRISPGQTVHNGTYWVLEHGYPTKLRGWLVLVLKRHATALHELTPDEFNELLTLQSRIITLIHEQFHSEKEYVICLAESPGFEHVHVHYIPRPGDLPEAYRGAKIFKLMGVKDPLPRVEVAALCEELQRVFA